MNEPRYRVRGLPILRRFGPAQKVASDVVAGAAIESPSTWLGRIAQSFGTSRLSHYLLQGVPTPIRALWPTFGFLGSSQTDRPIHGVPLALGSYLSTGDEPHQIVTEILRSHQERENLAKGFATVVSAVTGKGTGKEAWILSSPLAAGFALHLCRGNQALHDRIGLAREMAAQLPVTAFIALAAGAPENHHARLLASLKHDDRLVIEALSLEGMHSADLDILGATPLHYAIAAGRKCESKIIQKQSWENLLHAAEDDALSAAFCAGASPHHPHFMRWMRLAMSRPETAYWAIRTGMTTGDALPFYARDFRSIIIADPKWLFLFVRDFAPNEAEAFIEDHWPSPWAVELAEQVSLSPTRLLSIHKKNVEDGAEGDPLVGAAILWLSAYLDKEHES